MKPVVHLLRAIQHAITLNRQRGASTMLRHLSEREEVFIIAGDLDVARTFGPAGVSMQSMIRDIEGHRPRAIFFDNHAILNIAHLAQKQFEADDNSLSQAVSDSFAWQQQHAEMRNKYSSLKSNYDTARDAARIQMQAKDDEILALKIKLNVRKVTHITVKRRK